MKTTPEMDLAIGRGVRINMQALLSGMIGERAVIQFMRLPEYQRAEAAMVLSIKQELEQLLSWERDKHH